MNTTFTIAAILSFTAFTMGQNVPANKQGVDLDKPLTTTTVSKDKVLFNKETDQQAFYLLKRTRVKKELAFRTKLNSTKLA